MANKVTNDPSQNMTNYEAIIAKYPLFCLLGARDIHELALIAKPISIKSGALITKENDIVDKVFLIISGTADVTRTITNIEKSITMHITTLSEGDAIGLAEAGFFSHRGIRTATVIATSDMQLLEFDIQSLQDFLQRPGIPYPGLRHIGEKVLLMNFLQKSHLFKDFSVEKIQTLAKKVNKISAKAGTILFKDGDVADKCYFILSGKIAVTSAKDTEKKLYEPSNIFGEEDFILNIPRLTTANAETDCELFVLNKAQIVEAEKTHSQDSILIKLIMKIKKWLGK